ncbi:MAG: RebB family R body protein [Desulfatibacillum sp.]|nr:RebB family R body protein [Desulfatibacillum sp.]
MADHSVNSQITDAITQLNSLMVGKSAPQSMAIMSAVMADTMGMALHNAVSTQHHAQMIGGASTTSTCARMLGVLAPPPVKITTNTLAPKSPPGSRFFDCDYCAGTASKRKETVEKDENRSSQAGLLSKFAEMFRTHHKEEHEQMVAAPPPHGEERASPAEQAGEDAPGPVEEKRSDHEKKHRIF